MQHGAKVILRDSFWKITSLLSIFEHNTSQKLENVCHEPILRKKRNLFFEDMIVSPMETYNK